MRFARRLTGQDRLVEKFLRWVSDAFAAGIQEAELEKPLPPVYQLALNKIRKEPPL
jgi:hypothetical protein